MKLIVLLVLLPSLAIAQVDGGLSVLLPTIDTYNCPPAPVKVEVDGGYFETYARDEREACIIVASQKERDLWKIEAANKPPSLWPLYIGGPILFLAGLALGRILKH